VLLEGDDWGPRPNRSSPHSTDLRVAFRATGRCGIGIVEDRVRAYIRGIEAMRFGLIVIT
jgi:hypothetical protein